MYQCTYLQFDEKLEVRFDGTGTKVVDLPKDHCSCKPRPGAYQDQCFSDVL